MMYGTMYGVYGVARAISDSVYLGREIATAQRVVLAKVGATDLTFDELRSRFGYQIDGIAPLRAIVAVKNRAAPHGAICVEAIPTGPSLADQPVPAARRGAVALALAKIVARAHGRGVPLVGLRPDLVFVGEAVTIAPRWARFLALRSEQVKFVGEPEAHADPALGHDDDPRVDVYLLGRLLALLWPDAPDEIVGLICTMTVRDPARRPTIAEVIYALTCARVSAKPAACSKHCS